MFILDRIDRELLHSLERLELKFGLSSAFFDKIRVRILLEVLFRVFKFSKASFCALTSSFINHDILKLRRHLDTETYVMGCHGNFVISHVKLQINAEISRQN